MPNKWRKKIFIILFLSFLFSLELRVSAEENDLLFDSQLVKSKSNISPEVVNKIKQSIVKITSYTQGSGVIIDKDINTSTYSVMTAWHNLKSMGSNEDIVITTFDGKKYYSNIQKVKNIGDMAWVSFSSDVNYSPAPMALTSEDSKNIQIGDTVIISGYFRDQIKLSVGILLSKSVEFTNDGYGLNYTGHTWAGMSGGGVFDNSGRLIGMHGQASKESRASKLFSTNVKSGTSIGMPVFVAERREIEPWDPPPVHEARNLVQYLESQIEINPSKDLFIALANNYSNLKYFDKAFDFYDLALREYSDQMPDWEIETILTLRAASLISIGRPEKARKAFDELISFQKKNGKPYIDSVLLKIKTYPRDQQLKIFEDWVQLNGEHHLNSMAFHLCLRNMEH